MSYTPENDPTLNAHPPLGTAVLHEQGLGPDAISVLLAKTKDSELRVRPIGSASVWPFRISYSEVSLRTQQEESSGNVLDLVQPGLRKALYEGEEAVDVAVKASLEILALPGFRLIPLGTTQSSDELLACARLFDADQGRVGVVPHVLAAGLVDMFGNHASVFEFFPAIEIQGRPYRLLSSKANGRDPVWLEREMNRLGLPAQVKQKEGQLFAAVLFEAKAETPVRITNSELEAWMSRLEASDAQLGLDVAASDERLDNLLRTPDGLRWCDGDIIDLKPFEGSSEDKARYLDGWRKLLQRFIENDSLQPTN